MSEVTNESPNKKKSLGRGLGSLLSSSAMDSTANVGATPSTVSTPKGQSISPQAAAEKAPQPVSTENRVWSVGVDKIKPSPFQPRTSFERTALEELASSIKTSGILQPIVVRKSKPEGAFEIVAGERRWRAAQIAGLHEVPVIVKDFSDKQTLELALVENLQREDLNPIEEAEAFQRLAQEFNLTQQQVSERVGKERATVANSMRLLSLPIEIQEKVRDKKLSVGHAKLLMSVSDPKQARSLAQQVENLGLSVRALEMMLKKAPASANEPLSADDARNQSLVKSLQDKIQKSLGTKVTIDYEKGKGKLSLYFYSDEELNQMAERLVEDV